MTKTLGRNSLRCLLLSTLISLQLISGLGDDSSEAKNALKSKSGGSSGTSVGLKVVIIGLGLVSVVGFAVLLFKIWQKKKREEQHARLLRLFEEDDELELELGLRD